jgi:hypothetical protein
MADGTVKSCPKPACCRVVDDALRPGNGKTAHPGAGNQFFFTS